MQFSGKNFKVYILEKIIIFSDTPLAGDVHDTLDFRNREPEDLWGLFIDFVNDKTKTQLTLLSYDPAGLLKQFASFFVIIEAAGGVVKNPEGKLLVIYRWQKWDLPKGKLDQDEEPMQGAMREVTEECGIQQLNITTPLPFTLHVYPLKDKWALKKTHWYAMITEDPAPLIPQQDEGIEKACWIGPDQLPMVLANTYESLGELFTNAFSKK